MSCKSDLEMAYGFCGNGACDKLVWGQYVKFVSCTGKQFKWKVQCTEKENFFGYHIVHVKKFGPSEFICDKTRFQRAII